MLYERVVKVVLVVLTNEFHLSHEYVLSRKDEKLLYDIGVVLPSHSFIYFFNTERKSLISHNAKRRKS